MTKEHFEKVKRGCPSWEIHGIQDGCHATEMPCEYGLCPHIFWEDERESLEKEKKNDRK